MAESPTSTFERLSGAYWTEHNFECPNAVQAAVFEHVPAKAFRHSSLSLLTVLPLQEILRISGEGTNVAMDERLQSTEQGSDPCFLT